jgi:hypothetical protein
MADPEARAYWKFAEKTAAEVATWPAWKRGEKMSESGKCVKCAGSGKMTVGGEAVAFVDVRVVRCDECGGTGTFLHRAEQPPIEEIARLRAQLAKAADWIESAAEIIAESPDEDEQDTEDATAMVAECRAMAGVEVLSVYSDDYEWVIAKSPADATEVCVETTGETRGAHDLSDDERWEALPPFGTTKMWCNADGKVCEQGEGTLTALTNREWIEKIGRGYLGGTEG